MRLVSSAVVLLPSFLPSSQAVAEGPDCGTLISKDKSQGPKAWEQCFEYLPPKEDIMTNPYSDCADPNHYCKGDSKWWASCQPIPSTFEIFDGPSVDMYVPTGCAGTGHDSCPAVQNFGPELSAADVYDQEDFPPVQQRDHPIGYDNSISILVGGNFESQQGAEVEGKIVVLGDFVVGPNGANSLVQVGVGSQIVPEKNQVVMTVGGSFIHGGNDNTNILIPGGDVQIGGSLTSTNNPFKLDTRGQIMEGVTIDRQRYEDMFDDLADKSKYWSSLYPSGKFTPATKHPNQNTIKFESSGDDEECLQVFHIDRFDLGCPVDGACNIEFDSSLKDKTILINVASYEDITTGDRVAEINDIGIVIDYNYEVNGFVASDTKASIVWNVYDAKKFTICGGDFGGAQMPGSVLVPNGDLVMQCPGLDGRLMVKGDVIQNKAGSEFHNYEFDPSTCALPLPPTLSVPCECNPTPSGIVGSDFGTICDNNGVSLLYSSFDEEGSENAYPKDDINIEDIFYAIDVGSNDLRVKFRTRNPFDETLNMYVRYDKPVIIDGSSNNNNNRIDTCEGQPNVDRCSSALDADEDGFEAFCVDPRQRTQHGAEPYTIITVYLVDDDTDDGSLFDIQKNAQIHQCCSPPSDLENSSVVSFTFVMSCTCPGAEVEASRSLLRGA